ncbi:MAG: alpha/beta hydrolase, partial [Lysobacter sp.]|nr:alpha/beta hydrolase [Lysobacter sp.]
MDARTADSDTRKLLLIHGIWMPALSMRWMSARLAEAGFEPSLYAYAGAIGGPDAAVPGLVERLAAGPTHVLAHSLGGLITLSALAAHPDLPVPRVVCLGSPLRGSAA